MEGFPLYYAVSFYGQDGLSGLNLNTGEILTGNRYDQLFYFGIGYKGFWASDFKSSPTGQIISWGVFFLDQGEINTIGTTFWEVRDFAAHELDYISCRPVRCIKKEEVL